MFSASAIAENHYPYVCLHMRVCDCVGVYVFFFLYWLPPPGRLTVSLYTENASSVHTTL